MTMSLVQTVTVGSGGASEILFSNIPQDATDLLILFSGRSNTSGTYFGNVFLNASSIDTWKRLSGDGSSAASSNSNPNFILGTNTTSNTFTNTSFYVTNYAATVLSTVSIDATTENNATSAEMAIGVGIQIDPVAVTSFKLITNIGSFVQHSSASLYKITKA